jgi:5-methylcytosine-specific restriction enzyme A
VDRTYGLQAWKRLARAILERDGGICGACGKPGADTVHHRREKRDGGTDAPDNLMSVCKRCHARLHGKRGA